MASFDDAFAAFGDIFGDKKPGDVKKEKKPEKGLPWAAKSIDGKIYVPLEQVIELLAQNEVLPAVRKGLENHLNKQ